MDEILTSSNDSILALGKKKTESEESILEVLKEMVAKVKGDLEAEWKEWEAAEETLLGLLETTTSKISVSKPLV